MEIAASVGLVAFVVVALLYWRSFLPTYFQEKAKNLATKEDIRQITESVESVKNRFEQDNERLRHALERSNHVTKFQFEKEYDLYRSMWASLVELKRTTLALRPPMDYSNPNEVEEEKKKKRLTLFSDAYEKTANAVEMSLPFYPASIFKEAQKLLHSASREAINYHFQDQSENWQEYWNEAQASRDAILTQIEGVEGAIRDRLETFRSANVLGQQTI